MPTIQQLEEELYRLRGARNDLETQLTDAHHKIDKLTRENRKLQGESDDCQRDRGYLEDEKKSLTDRCHVLEGEVAGQESTISNLKREIMDLRSVLRHG